MDTQNCEMENMIVCDFGLRSPNISAYEFHEWIYDQMCLNDQESTMVQIDVPKRQVYIMLREVGRMQDKFHSTGEQAEYYHSNGEISTVRISTAAMGTRRERIANLPPEMSDGVPWTVLSRYGEVRDIQAETCSLLYR